MTGQLLQLTESDVAEFAAASGDINPLHLDPGYARCTPYGRTVVHGALVALAALGTVRTSQLVHPASLSIDFLAPVYPGQACTAEPGAAGGVPAAAGTAAPVQVRVRSLGETAVMIRLTPAPGSPVLPLRLPILAATDRLSAAGSAVQVWEFGELRRAPAWHCTYAPDLRRLRALADRLGAAGVPDSLLLWLARSSWVAGTRAPGRDGLLAGLRLTPAGGAAAQRDTRIEVAAADPRVGSVVVHAAFTGPEGGAGVELRTFLRNPVRRPTRASVRAHLPAGSGLSGSHILVAGGSRGFGAALAGALASQEATVWVIYAQSDAAVAELRDEFGPSRIRPVRCDAADPGQLAVAIGQLAADGIVLDGIALTAAPPLRSLPEAPEAVVAAVDFVQRSLALAAYPLTAALPLIHRDTGWLMATSSTAMASSPPGWGHYAAAKAALETYTSHCGRRRGLRTLLLRAPKMHTDLVNGPTGKVDSVPPEQVAAAAVRWVLARADAGDSLTVLGPTDLIAPAFISGVNL